MRAPFAVLIALVLSPALAKGPSGWKSDRDFREAAPLVHRQALWLEANPGADTWGDSLKTVLTWSRGVPYATLGTAKIFEKELQNLPKDPEAGRVASMKAGKPDYSIPAMERLAGLMHSGALDDYIQAKLRK